LWRVVCRLLFVYQDEHRPESFFSDGNEVRTVKADDLGMVVSVTIAETIDTGSTTFSLLIPAADLPDQQLPVFIRTEGITTVHRLFVGLLGHPQAETYAVTELDGMASFGPLPL
jgi:hypothetical protein